MRSADIQSHLDDTIRRMTDQRTVSDIVLCAVYSSNLLRYVPVESKSCSESKLIYFKAKINSATYASTEMLQELLRFIVLPLEHHNSMAKKHHLFLRLHMILVICHCLISILYRPQWKSACMQYPVQKISLRI